MSRAPLPVPPPTRAAVAVLLSRFPKVTETFILREVEEMERQGQPVVLAPLLREYPPVVHPAALPWLERALFSPFLSVPILAANASVLRRAPLRYLSTLGRALAGSIESPKLAIGTLGIWPRSVWLGEELQRRGVRHVHAHFATHPAMAAWIIGRTQGIGMSFTAHAHDLFVASAFLGEKVEAARFVRAISRFNRDWLADRIPAAGARTVVIRCGIDLARYRALRPEPGPPVLLTVASLEPYKGHGVLLDAARRLLRDGVEFRIDLVGGGPLRPELEARVAALGLGAVVRFLGPLPEDEVARRMASCALFVLPSVVAADGQMEGLPVVLMEALAAERPVVASRLSGIPELIEDGVTGALVTPGDPAALAEAIRAVLSDPAAASKLARRGRARVEAEHDIRAVVAELCAEIDRVNPAPSWFAAEALGLGPGPVGLLRLHDRKDSFVAELVVGGRRLVYKAQRSRPGQSAPPEARARREFAMLERLRERLATPCSVPAPLRLDADRGALLMAAAAGRSLEEIVRERRWSLLPARVGALDDAVWRAGLWLRRFHQETGAVHGDFWPGNVFVSPAAVEVIDFEGTRDGAIEQDIDYFLGHLSGYFRWPLLRRRGRRLAGVFRSAAGGGDRAARNWVACGRHRLAKGDWQARWWFSRHLFVAHGLGGRLLPARFVAAPAPPPAIAAGLEEAGPVRLLHVEGYREDGQERELAFVFAAGAGEPSWVLKRRLLRAEGASLKVEHEALRGLRERLPPELARSLPRPLGFSVEAGRERLQVEALRGRSAYVELLQTLWPESLCARHFALAARWLAAFHLATRSGREARVAGDSLPLSAAHGDFWARNLLVVEGEEMPRVVDLEHFHEPALPLDDLFHFIVSYGLAYPWRRWRRIPPEQAFLHTVAMDTPVARAARSYLRDYCGRTGLDPRRLESWFRFQLARWAEGESPRGEDGALWSTLIQSIERRDLFAFSG